MQDNFLWVAVYEDGSIAYQRDPQTGDTSAYKDIDRDKLKFFHMVTADNYVPFISLDFSEGDGDKLVWTRRVQMRATNEGSKQQGQVYILGKKGRFIIVLHMDGTTQIVNNFQEDNPLIYPIKENK